MTKLLFNFTDSIQHEGTVRSNAQALLQSAWLGDAVSVKKSLVNGYIIKRWLCHAQSLTLFLSLSFLQSGRGIDVNCCNSDGMTPLLLVTRDIELFDKGDWVLLSLCVKHMQCSSFMTLCSLYANQTHAKPTLTPINAVQYAMQTDYNPVQVMEDLIKKQA